MNFNQRASATHTENVQPMRKAHLNLHGIAGLMIEDLDASLSDAPFV